MAKSLPANAEDARDSTSTPESGRSPGAGNGNPHSSILAWRIPWTEEPGGYRPWKCKDIIEQLNTHTHQSIAVSILFFHHCLLIQTKLNLVQRILLKCSKNLKNKFVLLKFFKKGDTFLIFFSDQEKIYSSAATNSGLDTKTDTGDFS